MSNRKKVISKPVLCPLFDHSLSIIGYEPAMRSKDVITCMESFSEVERMNDFDITGVNRLFWEQALESYTGELPLFLHRTSCLSHRFWDSTVIRKGRKVVLMFRPDNFPYREDDMLNHLDKLAELGTQFAIDDFGFGRFSIPMFFRIKPTYIRLAKEVLESCTDAKTLSELTGFLQPFRDRGIQVIAADIESDGMLNRARIVADILQGDWLTRIQPVLKPSLSMKAIGSRDAGMI